MTVLQSIIISPTNLYRTGTREINTHQGIIISPTTLYYHGIREINTHRQGVLLIQSIFHIQALGNC